MAEQEPTQKRSKVRTKVRRPADDSVRNTNVKLSTPIALRLSAAAQDQRKSKARVIEEALTAHLRGYVVHRPADSVGEDGAAA